MKIIPVILIAFIVAFLLIPNVSATSYYGHEIPVGEEYGTISNADHNNTETTYWADGYMPIDLTYEFVNVTNCSVTFHISENGSGIITPEALK